MSNLQKEFSEMERLDDADKTAVKRNNENIALQVIDKIINNGIGSQIEDVNLENLHKDDLIKLLQIAVVSFDEIYKIAHGVSGTCTSECLSIGYATLLKHLNDDIEFTVEDARIEHIGTHHKKITVKYLGVHMGTRTVKDTLRDELEAGEITSFQWVSRMNELKVIEDTLK
jgi:hypothetical protein